MTATYGNTSEIFFTAEKDVPLEAGTYPSLEGAKAAARAQVRKSTEVAIYRAELIGYIVLDEPRFVDYRPSSTT